MSNFSHIEKINKSLEDQKDNREDNGIPTVVDHTVILSNTLEDLFIKGDFSDITLIVEGEKIQCHKALLAARSEYFRAMLYGGLKEADASEVTIYDTNLFTFKSLMRYIYTGRIDIYMTEDQIIDLLGLAHKFFLRDLENAIASHLKSIISISNFCTVFNVAQMYEMKDLIENCLQYADYNAHDVLRQESFLDLTIGAVEELAARDSLYAPEIDIFKAVKNWIDCDSGRLQYAKKLLGKLRLSLIPQKDLLDTVRRSNLLSSDDLLDAIHEQHDKKTSDMVHRGCKNPNVNIACLQYGAKVLKGDESATFLSGDFFHHLHEIRIHTSHNIGDSDGIVVELGKNWIINTIRIYLPDREPKMYSYYIEVSVDNNDWLRIIDYSEYPCRGRQNLIFPPRAVRYIKIVGVFNTMGNKHFHATAIEALYSTDNTYQIEPFSDFARPIDNIATVEKSATVIEGVSRSRNALLNGNIDGYDWDTGYTCHQLGSGSITVQLPQPVMINSMRLLLWDCDSRVYSYHVEISLDQKKWKTIIDRRNDHCRSWQLLKFPTTVAVFVRIIGSYNSANEVFHIVHFECPASPAPKKGEQVYEVPTVTIRELSSPLNEDKSPNSGEEFIPEERD